MKKIVYMAPEMEIVDLKIQNHLLAGSNGGDGQGSSAGGSGSFDENEDLG
jgi:hypothetical protein